MDMAGDKEQISSAILWISVRTLINIILVFFLVEGFVTAYHFSYKLFSDFPYSAGSQNTMNITISQGESAMEVADVLEGNRIVESKYLFLARVYLGKFNSRIQAGTYTLGPGMSPEEICKEICGIQSEAAS